MTTSLRRVELVRTPQAVSNPYTSLGFRFTVVAQNAYLMDNEIFVKINRPIDPTAPDVLEAVYLGVCTPGEMANLFINGPPDEDPTARYRVSSIDQTYDSEVEAEAAWTAIQAGAQALKDALDATDELGDPESVWIGTPP